MTDAADPRPAPDAASGPGTVAGSTDAPMTDSSVAHGTEDGVPRRELEVPFLSYVVDGTTTTAHDHEMERRYQEAEARRDAIAAEEARAEKFDRATTEEEAEEKRRRAIDTGGGALYVNKLTRSPEIPKAYVRLIYCNRSGVPLQGPSGPNGPILEGLADIFTEDANDPNNLTINFVCLPCVRRNKHQQEAQIKMRQDNRKWVLHLGRGPAEFLFDLGDGPRRYKSAGVVDSERFSCPGCSWCGRIDQNRIIPD